MNDIQYLDSLLNEVIDGSGITKSVDKTEYMTRDKFFSDNKSLIDGKFDIWHAMEKLKNDGYVKEYCDMEKSNIGHEYWTFYATFSGRLFKHKGGYVAEQEEQELSIEKLRYDKKNAKRIFKTYWWTFFAAMLALVISIILLIIKFREMYNS